MGLPLKVVWFVVILGTVVFVHELGHFLMARALRVPVRRFSLGFGPRVWSRRWHGTEYQLAALPLGGYVQLGAEALTDGDGTNVGADGKRSDPSAEAGVIDPLDLPPLKRVLIALAGPAANVLLVPLVLTLAYALPAHAPPPVLGWVLAGEPADQAGLRAGDRVLAVDGSPVRTFDQLSEAVARRPDQPVRLTIARDGVESERTVTPHAEPSASSGPATSRAGAPRPPRGRIGALAGRIPALVAVRPGTAAARAGLQSFDRVLSVNGAPVHGPPPWTLPEGRPIAVVVERSAADGTNARLELQLPDARSLDGLESAEFHLHSVRPDSAAAQAGLRSGDRVEAVDGVAPANGVRLLTQVAALGSQPVTFSVRRGDERRTIVYTPPQVERRDPWMGLQQVTDVGLALHPQLLRALPTPEDELLEVRIGWTEAARRGLAQVGTLSTLMWEALQGLLTGEISTETIGGPVLVFQATQTVAAQGVAALLKLLALLSLDVAFMNMLPVPALDGFAVLLGTTELVSRRATPARVRQVLAYAGLVVMVALALLVLRNDILRLFFSDPA